MIKSIKDKESVVGNIYGHLTVIRFIKSYKHKRLWLCQCDCGKKVQVFTSALKTKNSCGCKVKLKIIKKTKLKMIGKTYGYLTVLDFVKKEKNNYYWKVLCVCGNIVIRNSSHLNLVKSCGCKANVTKHKKLKTDLIGFKSGKLTVREYYKQKKGKSLWKCICECGNEKIINISDLRSGDVKSCGNCGLFANGVKTSFKNKKIIEMLKEAQPQENFNIKKGLNVDAAIVKSKMCIEYNSWFYHHNKQKQDRKKVREILKLGWKILVIKANNELPSKSRLIIEICKLIDGKKKQKTLTLKSWGSGSQFRRFR